MARKLKKPVKNAAGITAVCLMAAVVTFSTIVPNAQYNQAAELMNKENYTEAASIFEKLGTFRDSEELAEECRQGTIYITAVSYMNSGDYEKANTAFESISAFRDSAELKDYCNMKIQENRYDDLVADGNLAEALAVLEKIQRAQGNADGKLYDLAVCFYGNDDYDNAAKALDLMKEQTASGNELRQNIEENMENVRNTERYEELTDLVIDDSKAINAARELIDLLPSDYEDVSEYEELLDLYEDYIGYYQGPGELGGAVIKIEDKTVYLETESETLVLEQGNLSVANYIDEMNNSLYTVNSPNAITVIMVIDGNVIYESFVR